MAVIVTVGEMGFTAAPILGGERTAICVLGNKGVDDTKIRDLPGVQQAIHVSKPYKLVSVTSTRKIPSLMWPESRSVKASGQWWWVVPCG